MSHANPLNTPPAVPLQQAVPRGGPPESRATMPGDVVPPEIERELPPHTEVRLVYWLRREYWTRLISPVVSVLDERKAQ